MVPNVFPYSDQHYQESTEAYFEQHKSLTATECGMLSKKVGVK